MPRSLRIAVIDDNQDVVATMTALLETEGHQTMACYTGTEALSRIQKFKPDVVLLDIGLPGESGWEVARKIRKSIGQTHPMIIGITGQFTKGADRILAEMNGIDYYLIKPADPIVLLSLLEQAKPSR
ncbi:MAG TPA: response regulator [Burkholderiales bacterium]|nr:response regulator [Burkholderiales bacterium]